MGEFYSILKEELIPNLHNIFQEREKETSPNTSYEARISLVPKPDKGSTAKKGNYRPILLMNLHEKILKKY